MAHQLTKTAEQLTYRQLCILKLAVVKDDFGLRNEDYRGQGALTKELYQVLYECLDLYLREYINFGGEVAFGPTDVKPKSMTIQGMGTDLFNLMKLSRYRIKHNSNCHTVEVKNNQKTTSQGPQHAKAFSRETNQSPQNRPSFR